MKQGKVFSKLASDKRVREIRFSEKSATVILAEGFYAKDAKGHGVRAGYVTSAHEAEAFIRSALKEPTPREGFKIVYNMMTNLPVEERIGTPYTCSVQSETYWSS